MTDYSLVKEELMKALNCDEAQAEKYESYINHAILSVEDVLKSTVYENDIRIVHLCAMRAYYQIVLTADTDDGIVSFKSGDISYTRDTSSVARAKALLDFAAESCSEFIQNNGFVFKAV